MDEKQKFGLGHIASPPDPRNIRYKSIYPVGVMVPTLPPVFSLRDTMPKVLNQGALGQCVGCATSTAKTQREYKATGIMKRLSPRFMYATCKSVDNLSGEGTYPIIAMQVEQGVGIAEEEFFPMDISLPHQQYISGIPDTAVENAFLHRSGGYAYCNSTDEIKAAIYNEGAITVAVTVLEDYLATDGQGLIQPPHGQIVGGHYITLCGWNDYLQRFEVQNSWGNSWGENDPVSPGNKTGYGWIPYNYGISDVFTTTNYINGGITTGAPVNLIHPVKNPHITQGFGENPQMYAQYGLKGHNGNDYGCPTGTDVFAIDDGIVTYANIRGAYGICVMVQTTWGGYLLGHLKQALFGPGVKVTKGQVIAISDNTGNSTGPHVHLGGWINGVTNPGFGNMVDLEPYIKEQNTMPDSGFAFIGGGPGQVFYSKISSPDGFKNLAVEHGIPASVAGSVKDISKFGLVGFALGNNGSLVVFFIKMATLAERDLLAKWNNVPANFPRVDFETL